MPYDLALLSAVLDAEMVSGATVEQDVDNSRIVIKLAGQVIGTYPYKT